jgi:hypothetical protein
MQGLQGFGYRILPNNDPNINQSFIVIPEGPGFSNGFYPDSNYIMSNKSRKKHRKSSNKHKHRHYEGQYGQFGMPVLSPEFLSPEFPVPIPMSVPVAGYGYGYGYTNPANEALTIITKAANDASTAAPGANATAVKAAIKAILPTLNNPVAAAVVSAARTSADSIVDSTTLASDAAKKIIAAASAAVTTPTTVLPFGISGIPNLSPGPYPVLSPRYGNVRHITDPDADPELRRKVIKHFYKELKEKYFIDKFNKFFQYIIIENDDNNNNSARLVKTYEEYKKNENNYTNSNKKIKFITENIFTKYDLEVLISKLIAKYGMLNSDDENNMHWYNSKNKYAGLIKKAMYKKIKYRLEKKVDF